VLDDVNVARVIRVDAASRRMLRARDKMDRSYDKPLDVAALARIALTSEAHFIRTFKQTFGETPHRYLQRRRLERAMALLRETERPVTEICLDVGFTSLGTFSRTFTQVVGMSPTAEHSGLDNLRQRAESRSGTFQAEAGDGGTGTRIIWQVPLR